MSTILIFISVENSLINVSYVNLFPFNYEKKKVIQKFFNFIENEVNKKVVVDDKFKVVDSTTYVLKIFLEACNVGVIKHLARHEFRNESTDIINGVLKNDFKDKSINDKRTTFVIVETGKNEVLTNLNNKTVNKG